MEFSEERLNQAVEATVEEIKDKGGLDNIGEDDVFIATNDAMQAIAISLFTLTEVLVRKGVVSPDELERRRVAITAGIDQDLKRFQDAVNERIREGDSSGYEG